MQVPASPAATFPDIKRDFVTKLARVASATKESDAPIPKPVRFSHHVISLPLSDLRDPGRNHSLLLLPCADGFVNEVLRTYSLIAFSHCTSPFFWLQFQSRGPAKSPHHLLRDHGHLQDLSAGLSTSRTEVVPTVLATVDLPALGLQLS
jgi:hypothetical protein